jgi:hypothetical protein
MGWRLSERRQTLAEAQIGFRGSQRVVSEWATRRRRSEKASDQQLQKVPSARTIARLMTSARDHMSKADTVTIAAIEAGVPTEPDLRPDAVRHTVGQASALHRSKRRMTISAIWLR